MPQPLHILSVTPGSGHTGGRTVVELVGSGFRTPTPPPPTGKTVPPPPSMRVLFGDTPALGVDVVSSHQLYAIAPIHDAGAVDVTADVLDDDGNVTASTTKAAAYTFLRPDLSAKSHLQVVVETLVLELRRQVTQNVELAVHTDYDATTGDGLNLTFVAKLPAIVLSDMKLDDADAMEAAKSYDVRIDDDTFVTRRPPVIVDLGFKFTGVSDVLGEAMTLLTVMRQFFKKNASIAVPRDPDDPSRGMLDMSLGFDLESPLTVTRQSDGSNLHVFTGSLTVYWLRLEDMPGLPSQGVTGVPAWLGHESTTRFGWTARSVSIDKQRK